MNSRYDYYDESTVLDIDGINFPDPLKLNLNNGELTKIPIAHTVSVTDIAKPWTLMEKTYNREDLDDILLLENTVPYIMALAPGDKIYLPKEEDLTGFIDSALSDKSEVNDY